MELKHKAGNPGDGKKRNEDWGRNDPVQTEEEKIDAVAAELLERFRPALEELAK